MSVLSLAQVDMIIEAMSPGVKRALVDLRDNSPGVPFGPCMSILQARGLTTEDTDGQVELTTLGKRVAMRLGDLP